MPAMAQQGNEVAPVADDVEVIQVTGIRASARKNLNEKRFSDSVVDAISAEDVGKFPDRNVAESLQRVPGVSITRQFGEGASVSIRGAGDDLTLTTLNGQNVASTGWFVLEPAKRSFNYELLPSELVGDLKVYKSSQADLAEGGVGGTVEVNTRKPLDMDSYSFYGSMAGLYQSDSEEWDPQLSALGSWKNDDENFGVLISGVMQDRTLQRQGNEAFWEWGAGPVAFEQERSRSSLAAVVQYAPTDNMTLTLNAINMEMEANNTNYAVWLTQADTTWAGAPGSGAWDDTTWIGGTGLANCDNGAPCAGSGTQISGPLNVAYYQARPREATMESTVIDLEMEYQGDNFNAWVQIGDSSSDGGTDFEMVVEDGTGGTPIPGGTYDFTSGEQKWDLNGFDLENYVPSTVVMGTGSNFNATPKTDDEQYAQADIEFPVDYGAIAAIKFGTKYSMHETTSRRYEFQQDASFDPTISTAGILSGKLDVGTDNYAMTKIDDGALKRFAKDSITGKTEDLGSYSKIEEDSFALYAMASYSMDSLRGNFGVRYVTTDATSTYYLEGVRTSTDSDYSEVLPSFNAAFDLADDLILRFSAARTMARPQYIDMYVNPDVLGANDNLPDNQFWVVGNIGLDPFIANQFDLGIEWYFTDDSLMSATWFRKDVSNFVTINEYHADSADIPFGGTLTPEEEAAGWTVQEKQNGQSAEIEGLELQYQQDFGNGLGAIVNYTYTDTTTDSDTFTDANPYLSNSSKNTYNVTGFYENELIEVRMSYNWRDEYMLREPGAYGNRLHDDYGSLDLSARWHVTDYLDISIDAVNLLEEESKQYGNNQEHTDFSGFTEGFPTFQYQQARMITVGASVNF
nr:TonB-dependent receptor [Echinimonas agarilytica]